MIINKQRHRAGFLVLALFAALVLAIPAGAEPGGGSERGRSEEKSQRYIVTLRDDIQHPRRVANEHANEHGARVRHIYEHALRGYSARIPERRVAALRADSRVLSVVEDKQVSIAAQELPTGVDRVEADLSSTQAGNGSGTVNTAVAVIDTGVDLDHPDLKVVPGKNCTLMGLGAPLPPDDDHGHGTHVATVIPLDAAFAVTQSIPHTISDVNPTPAAFNTLTAYTVAPGATPTTPALLSLAAIVPAAGY